MKVLHHFPTGPFVLHRSQQVLLQSSEKNNIEPHYTAEQKLESTPQKL